MGDYETRLRGIKSRQQQWMRERESALEREDVEREIVRERGLDAPSAGAPASPTVAPEQLVDALTVRLAEKIKRELRMEDRDASGRAGGSGPKPGPSEREEAKVLKLEGFLAKEIASHTCPICYELMVPPNHAPLLLFPCGHTFCTVCLREHERHAKRRCPYCRAKIESAAANISLQQLIQNYLTQKHIIARNGAGGPPGGGAALPTAASADGTLIGGESGGGGGEGGARGGRSDGEEEAEPARDLAHYERQFRGVEMRMRILENELLDTKEEERAAEADLAAADQVVRAGEWA